MEGQEDQVMEVENSEANCDKSTDVNMSCDLAQKKPKGHDFKECKSDCLAKDPTDIKTQQKVVPLKSMEPKQKFDENEENGETSSESCSSSFSLSDEETPEEKAEFIRYKNSLKEKYGLDKLPKFDKMEKLSAKVKCYSIERKRQHREEISAKDWHKLRLYKNDHFLDDWAKENVATSTKNIDRINAHDITVEEFMEKYEKPGVPVILLGCAENWDALNTWNFPDLVKKYGKCKLKIGEDDEGYPLKLRLKHFIEYMLYNKDDSPLYLFQSSIESRKKVKDLVKDYTVPKFFQDDYFKIMGTNTRPPFRWLLIGPKRSGTTIHCDPLSTSAWNTSLVGHKKWLLFPPHHSKDFVKGRKYKQKGEDDEAIHYFKTIYPRIIEGENVDKLYEFVQGPGETVFIPGRWWHAVLNLNDTIAITQNYCNRGNFDRVWRDCRKNRKKMACRWLRKMKIVDNELYKKALKINREDKFMMYDIARMNKVKWPYSESSSSSSSTSLSDYDFDYSESCGSESEEKAIINEEEVKLDD